MTMLVTLAQAKSHLRVTIDDEDADIELKVMAASRIILRYLQSGADFFLESTGEPYLDSNGIAPDVPDDVKMATLVMTGYLYKNRDEDEGDAFDIGKLPSAVTALIYHLRPLSMA